MQRCAAPAPRRARSIDGTYRLVECARGHLAVDDDDRAIALRRRRLPGALLERRAHEVVVHNGHSSQLQLPTPIPKATHALITPRLSWELGVGCWELLGSLNLSLELLSLDAGGVLVFPNFERISDTFARHRISVAPEALRAADPHGRRAVDTEERVRLMNDADRGSMYFRIISNAPAFPPTRRSATCSASSGRTTRAQLVGARAPDVSRRWNDSPPRLPLAIGSNANGIIHRVFERSGLRRYFSVICDSQVKAWRSRTAASSRSWSRAPVAIRRQPAVGDRITWMSWVPTRGLQTRLLDRTICMRGLT